MWGLNPVFKGRQTQHLPVCGGSHHRERSLLDPDAPGPPRHAQPGGVQPEGAASLSSKEQEHNRQGKIKRNVTGATYGGAGGDCLSRSVRKISQDG